jgi:transposase-like protein
MIGIMKARDFATATAASEEAGDAWTWTALDADTKLIVSFLVGGRDACYAYEFMRDVVPRLVNRLQLTTERRLSAVGKALRRGAHRRAAEAAKKRGPKKPRKKPRTPEAA